MKIIIAGGREFNDIALMYKIYTAIATNLILNKTKLFDKLPEVEIVTGGAKGADTIASEMANKIGDKLTVFKADWDKYGKAAGPIRNKKMAEYADVLIAFWDGKSRGTKNMIKQAYENNLKVNIINY